MMSLAIAPPAYTESLRELARQSALFAPREAAALHELLDRKRDGTALAPLLTALVTLRMRLLMADSEEAGSCYEDALATARSLRGPLLDQVHEAPARSQERVIAYLRELAVDGPAAFAQIRVPLEAAGLVTAAAGDFKRGKSTLLNALLGMRLLPTRVAPATAVPCLLRYAPAINVQVFFGDGQNAATIAPEDLPRYALIALPNADDENLLAFRDEVARIEIGLPWTLPMDLTLVDLPGLNEEEGRAEMAHAALRDADAVLVVLSATQLLAEDELRFIENLWSDGHRVLLFAINFRDKLEEDDLALVRERAARLLAPFGGRFDETIFLLSARAALLARVAGEPAADESGMDLLDRHLRALLTGSRETIWHGSRLRQVLERLEDAEHNAGFDVLDAQDEARRQRIALDTMDTRLAEAKRQHGEAEEAAAHALAMTRQRLADHDRAYDGTWEALLADLQIRCRKEPLPWVWQQAGAWLRDELIVAIRQVDPMVTLRPERYLRIRVAPSLRLTRDSLFSFYHDEAAREWERFTNETRRTRRQELEAALAEAEQEPVRVREAWIAGRRPLEEQRVVRQQALTEAETERDIRLDRALAACEALRGALQGCVI